MTVKAEKELINLLKKGNRNAFNEIYNVHKDALYTFALKATNSADDAKDLVQDTFLSALKALNEFKENIDSDTSLSPYLFISIKNRFLNKIRREKRFDHYADIILKNIVLNNELTPEEKVILNENREYLLDKINNLPEKCRETFVLNKLENYSITEIADKMALSPQTVKNQLVKAKKYIKPYQREILESAVSIIWMLFTQ